MNNQQQEKCVLIMAGGTGGHVFPGLAAAASLQKKGVRVEWLGTQRGIEAELVPANDIPISYIHVAGVRGKGLLQLLAAPLQIMRALLEAIQVIRRVKPNCVLGMGGFASGPGGLAAWLLRKPLLIHEQNAVPGTTNRILSVFAKNVMEAFPGTFPGAKNPIAIGNPVRAEIAALATPTERGIGQQARLRLLVLGGSLGAKAINEMLPELLKEFPVEHMPDVWHQTGKVHFKLVSEQYADLESVAKTELKVEAFIADMAEAYGWADLVICRAGALTVSELAAAGVASMLIPFPHAIDDHQTKNAQWLVSKGAAYLLPQSELDVKKLAAVVIGLSEDRAALLDMANKARAQSLPAAAEEVAQRCLEVANG